LNQLAETKSFLDSLLTSAEFEKLHMVNLDQKKKYIYIKMLSKSLKSRRREQIETTIGCSITLFMSNKPLLSISSSKSKHSANLTDNGRISSKFQKISKEQVMKVIIMIVKFPLPTKIFRILVLLAFDSKSNF
jgi:hypothetical protein